MKKVLTYVIAIIILQILLSFVKNHPLAVEKIYSSNFYLAIHTVLTFFHSWTKISIGDLLYILVTLFIITKIVLIIKNKKTVLKKTTLYILQTLFQFLICFQL